MRLLRSSKAALALALVFVLVAGHLAQPGPPTDDEEDADVEEASGQMDDQQTDAGFTDTAVFDRRPASSTTAPVVDTDAEDLGTEDAGDDDDDDLSLDGQPGNQNTDGEGTAGAGVMAPSKEIVPAYESSSTPPQVTYQSTRSKLLAIISKPGILAGIVGGAVIGILTAILLIMFIVYRMRKKDEGSYALEETKKPLSAYDYRHCPTKEFYA